MALLKLVHDLRPDVRIVSVSQNDNQRYCRCEKCMALAEQEGGQIGPLLHFVNAVANATGKRFYATPVTPEKIQEVL